MLKRTLPAGFDARRRLLRATAIVLLGGLLSTPLVAASEMREFTGTVERAGSKSLVVGNRMGDSVTFARTDGTKVSGAKSSWGDLAKGDRVTVAWKDNRQAHRVRVLPKKGGSKRK